MSHLLLSPPLGLQPTLYTLFSAPTPTPSGLSMLVPHAPTLSLVLLLNLQAHVESAH